MQRNWPLLFLFLLFDPALGSAQSSSQWRNLVSAVSPSDHAIAGAWSKTDDTLRTAAEASSRLAIPGDVPREYDLRVSFTRESGQHSVAVFLTCGSGRASFEVDAWAQHLAGFQAIAGQDCRSNPTRVENQHLQNGRRYELELRVRRQGVAAFIDGVNVVTYQGDGSDLSLLPLWQLPSQFQLGVGAYQSAVTFHRIELREASGAMPSASPVAMDRSASATPKAGQESRSVAMPNASQAARRSTAQRGRVLFVIADRHFFYREYAEPREELERAGFKVDVAAWNRASCYPHENSGQGSDGGEVRPDVALTDVDPERYDAIVFPGGWGVSMYQYAFEGRYNHPEYNGDVGKKQAANHLINSFVKSDKYVCGICNGVSVLAWSRVNGKSLLAGKQCTAPTRSAPPGVYNGRPGSPSIRWHVEQNRGRLVPAGSIGNPQSRADDVVVDDKIITAEDDQSAREAGRQLAELLSHPE
ncbi:DJ-1/PfpI family protein [Neorhodopirellula pilleata]|uniref:Phosphoribosylformylglycinamidine synthase 1 n=1 Tax=Neorhodopirellula pilleata TaxID=2714738 RepID=A0A5C6ACH4_9BACT|nr:DJ-1/PfpI family protein [Neorhodopirellula pilleata]TWT97299.1 Phosphoribosylformylglycinamidine synthase 1 [Neorhodopirellula pilleata]